MKEDCKVFLEDTGSLVKDVATPHAEISVSAFSGRLEMELDLHPMAMKYVNLGPDWLQLEKIGVSPLS